MNGDRPFRGSAAFALEPGRRGALRLPLAASLLLHATGLLTAPYWPSAPGRIADSVTVEITEIRERDLPQIPRPPAEAPPAPVSREPVAKPVPPPPDTRTIRERVAERGVLGVLARGTPGRGGADLLPRIRVPRDIRAASQAVSGEAPPLLPGAPPREPADGGREPPGIGGRIASAARASTALSSAVFLTDAGLEAEVSGGIEDPSRSPGAIAATVRQYQSGIRYAYNKELLANNGLSGRISVAFLIRPDGGVESAEISRSTVGWPPLEEAVLRRIRHWKFPESEGGAVRVTFPFVFHPEM
jgi:TonB family protein